ncbi:MAG TPA: lysylphosphatidylglycerol synthase transmembrane domain-containing protein, partial [Kofleriaceae bacterium]|nr:lysylphosphatidylglycerol synthase transmembrane domain-containing protein [Kofleriaceae bacterium]
VIGLAAFSMVGDVRHLGDSLAGFGWWALVAAIGLALANYVLRFVRWQVYLSRQDVSVPLASSALVFGAGLSLSITPVKLGELVKSLLLRDMHDVPAPRTAPIVVAERVTDLVALLALAVIGVAVYGVDPTLVAIAGVLIACGLLLLAWPRPTRALIDLVTRPAKLQRLRAPLVEALDNLVALCRPVPLIVATAIAIPAWACECVGFALICNAFPGMHVALGLAMVIYAGTTIAGALSFLPGGLGVTEGAMTLALVSGAAHFDRSSAVAATLLTRLATLWFAVALGLVFLALARRRIAKRAL